jgi:hypothetical protein
MAHVERRGLMDGIVKGLEHKRHRPVVDGIVCGVPRKAHLKASPDMMKVAPSATQSAEGVFGAGRTPQGDGNSGRHSGGMKIAGGIPRSTRKMEAEVEKHIVAHNR